MKKLSSIFLAVSMFFNLGFAFSSAKASPVPVPTAIFGDGSLLTDAGILYEVGGYAFTSSTTRLKRLTALEALIQALILGQMLPINIAGYDNNISTSDLNLIRPEQNEIKKWFTARPVGIVFTNEDRTIIKNHLDNINSNIITTKQRIKDLKLLIGSFLTGIPLNYGVSGVNNAGDINEIRQELFRAYNNKQELLTIKSFWEDLDDRARNLPNITSISASRGKSGDTITITGENLSALKEVFFENTRTFITLLNNNSARVTVPGISGVQNNSNINVFFFGPEDIAYGTTFTYETNGCGIPPVCLPPTGCSYTNPPRDANGCQTGCGTVSCPNGDSCRCPSGQVYVSVSGVKKCAVFNTSNLSCTRYGNVPVCGCDGMTYQNSCFALVSGLKTFTVGACPGQ